MKSLYNLALSTALGLSLPQLVLAATHTETAFTKFVGSLGDNLELLIEFLILVATVILIWGIVRYVGSGDDEDKVKEGRNLILYGVIGLATIMMLWGLVRIVVDFAIDPDADTSIPKGDELPSQ